MAEGARTVQVRQVDPDDHADVDAVRLAHPAAFADEAVLVWVAPDPIERAALLGALGMLLVEQIRAGAVETAFGPDGRAWGLALWRRGPGVGPSSVDDVAPGLSPAVTARLLAVLRAVAAQSPDRPHAHLTGMAITPRHRDIGIGTRLVRAGLRRAAVANLGTYLEASTDHSARLYRRLGFRDSAPPVRLGPSDDELVLRPMWLPPPAP